MPDIRVQLIRSSRLRLGEAPRSFDAKTRRYLKLKRPFLQLGMTQQLKSSYTNFQSLCEQGQVVWGVLVVASTDLFAKGHNDGRGVVVYSPHLHLHDDLLRLVDLAEKLGEERTRPTRDADEKKLFNKFNNNTAWFASQPIPSTLSNDDSILASSMLCVRKHMPRNLLVGNCFPILTHPKISSVAMLPELFWPEDLRDTWTGNG